MLCLVLALVLFDSNVETNIGYDEAYRNAMEHNKPLVVVVGADWCPACVEVKRRIFPNLFKRLQRNRFCYAEVDFDNERQLSYQLMESGVDTLPQTIIYYRENDNWRKKRWVGLKEVEFGLKIEIQRLTND